jgi:sorbitol-specific phosphotransferase system component IIBC
MKMSNKVYDVLKWVALVALDAIGLFYSTLATIWGLPLGDQVLATCAAMSLLIGTLIGVTSAQYNKTRTE